MRLSEKHDVPQRLALLYDFVNSIDLRSFVYDGAVREGGDELASPLQFAQWMAARNLVRPGTRLAPAEHREALALRDALRSFVAIPPGERLNDATAAARLSKAAAAFPLDVQVKTTGCTLEPAPGSSAVGLVLAEFYRLAEAGHLDRLKICGSDECRWIFFDLSKPSNARWCSSQVCGNREKTRTYRRRRRKGIPA